MARLALALPPWRVPGLSAARLAALRGMVPAELLPECNIVAATIAFRQHLATRLDTDRAERALLREAGRLLRAHAKAIPGALGRLRALMCSSPVVAAAIACTARTAPMDATPEAFAKRLRKVQLAPAIVADGDPRIFRVTRGRRNACPADVLMPLAVKLRAAGMRPGEVERVLATCAGVDTELVELWQRRYTLRQATK